jgi:hypothetical protein
MWMPKIVKRGPFYTSPRGGSEAMVQLALEKKAEVDARTEMEMTPLHVAAQYGRKAVWC